MLERVWRKGNLLTLLVGMQTGTATNFGEQCGDSFKNWKLSELNWMKSLSHVQLFATPWTVAHQAPPSMGFSRQEYWSGLPFPSPGDLPDPWIKPRSPALQADTLNSEPPGKLSKLPYDPAYPTAGHTPQGNQNWKRYMYPNVHCNTVYNS